jgi:hypothetical protein
MELAKEEPRYKSAMPLLQKNYRQDLGLTPGSLDTLDILALQRTFGLTIAA